MCHNTICAELVREAPKKLFGVQGFPETSVAEFWGFTGLFLVKEHIFSLSLLRDNSQIGDGWLGFVVVGE